MIYMHFESPPLLTLFLREKHYIDGETDTKNDLLSEYLICCLLFPAVSILWKKINII